MSTPTGGRKLRLLSLDGGGVRGLSSLFILKVLMDALNSKRNDNSLPPLKPCDVFDLIGGTSTGGLIAIMLGRLEMDVDQCITAYNDLSKTIFGEPRRRFPVGWSGNITPKFSSSALGDQIKKVIEACPGVSPSDLFNDNRERRCRVFVCATAYETTSTTRLRSYAAPLELEVKATIIEAALATSAATSFFEPVTIGGRTFADGALGANNPVGEVEAEALKISGAKNIGAAVKCFISIGTGVGTVTPIQDNVVRFFSETLVRISTETEATARRFLDRCRAEYEGNRYFRFNVQHGLQNVGLHEWEQSGLIEAATADYLQHMEQRVQLEKCIFTLLNPQGPLLKSPKIFAQECILVREDVLSFLNQAFSDEGKVTAVLCGLPGVGKTVMARYFANQKQSETAILWIPSGSEMEIRSAFSEYSRILTEQDREPPDFITVVGGRLTERFAQNWILVFDGLDDPSAIQLEAFIFPELLNVKILMTSQNANICDRVNASHIMQVPPLTEQAAEELLTMAATRGPRGSQGIALVSADEALARKRIVRDLGYLPVAIMVVGAILRGSRGSSPRSCQSYLRRCEEARDEDLEERSALTDYPSVWTAFDIAFRNIQSDGSSNSRRAAELAFFIASFEDASKLRDYIGLYRLLYDRDAPVQANNASTNAQVLRELRFLDQDFLRRSFDKLASANFITGNWAESHDDHVPFMEMHSLLKKWFRRIHATKVGSFVGPKLWLLGFGMHQQLEQTGVATHRYKALMSEARADLQRVQGSWPESIVPRHETVTAFLLASMTGLAKSVEHLPVEVQEQPGLQTYSDALRGAIKDTLERQAGDIDWMTVFEQFMDELGGEVESAVGWDSGRNPNYHLKDFFLETLDSAGCLPIAFRSIAPYELQLGGQVGLLQEFEWEATQQIASLLSTCLPSQATMDAAEICLTSGERRRSLCRNWCKKWTGDVSELIKRGLDQAFSTVCQLGNTSSTEAPQAATETGGAVLASLFSGFSALFPRNVFYGLLRRVIVDVVEETLGESDALDALDAKSEEMRDRCEQSIRAALAGREAEVFFSEPPSAETDDPTAFSMLWELAWGGRFENGLGDWVGSVIMDSISRHLKEAVIAEVEAFLLPWCASIASDLAGEIGDDSGVGNIFMNWIQSGWIDLPDDIGDHDAETGEHLRSDVDRTFRNAQASAVEIARSLHASSPQASSCEVVLRGFKDIFECRRVLHHYIMWSLSRPGLNDRTGLGAFFAKLFLEDCDKELALICSMIGRVTDVAYAEELSTLQQVENAWTMESSG